MGLRHLNPPGRSRHNVAHHYYLTDELFDTFLDPWRQYSCAYFLSETDTLAQAQVTKLARLAAKLNLQEGQRVLDIGFGWGGIWVKSPSHDVGAASASRESRLLPAAGGRSPENG